MKVFKDIREAAIQEHGKDPYRDFLAHRGSAKQRRIDFLLTFEEWWSLWEPHYGARGRGGRELCMCRHADAGPYAMGNVRIAQARQNHRERYLKQAYVAMQHDWGFNGCASDWIDERMKSARDY